MKDNTVKNNFARYARDYDRFACVQNQTAHYLANILNNANISPETILDIGCGTGVYTGLIAEKFPNSHINATDIAPEMLDYAKNKLNDSNISFLLEDAQNPNVSKKYDIITSNACLQWLSDHNDAIEKYSRMLNPDGIMAFSLFGPKTFNELQTVLRVGVNKDIKLSVSSFIDKNPITDIMNACFKSVNVVEDTFTREYKTLWELLKIIKHTGTRGEGLGAGRLSRADIAKLQDIYIETFGNIKVTYQIIYCMGNK